MVVRVLAIGVMVFERSGISGYKVGVITTGVVEGGVLAILVVNFLLHKRFKNEWNFTQIK